MENLRKKIFAVFKDWSGGTGCVLPALAICPTCLCRVLLWSHAVPVLHRLLMTRLWLHIKLIDTQERLQMRRDWEGNSLRGMVLKTKQNSLSVPDSKESKFYHNWNQLLVIMVLDLGGGESSSQKDSFTQNSNELHHPKFQQYLCLHWKKKDLPK